jgi:hypothetical protein
MKNQTPTPPEVRPGQSALAKEITNKRGFAQHWSFSVRKCDQLLAAGMPHIKLSARQIRINIPEADAWVQSQFRVQRRAVKGAQ